MNLKVGQVLWLKLPFGKTDDVSNIFHPYLILNITKHDLTLIEAGQMDSENDRPWEILQGKKIPVDNHNPDETVIYTISYLQTDRKIKIEYFDELSLFLDTTDTLSSNKLKRIIDGYYSRRNKYGSDNFRDMYFEKDELLKYNKMPDWVQAHEYRVKKYKN